MQPWNFLLITSPHLRAQITGLFEEINEGAAHRVVDQTCKRKQLYRSLKLEARIPDEHCRHLRPATGEAFRPGADAGAGYRHRQHLPGHPKYEVWLCARRAARLVGGAVSLSQIPGETLQESVKRKPWQTASRFCLP
jgi:hypothetical protein